MKKNQKKPTKQKGAISKKVSASFKKHLKKKIIDISELRMGKIRAEELDKTVISKEKLSEYDPVHGVYIYAQNKMSVFADQLGELPEMSRIVNPYADSQEEYMPSGPPTSPLTTSYFTCWGFFDLCAGIGEETFGTIAIDLCKMLGVDEQLIKVFQKMQNSRMGFYVHEGFSDKKVLLREIITKKQYTAIVPSGYLGEPGQIWFIRIMPEPFPELNYGYSVVFTTPYVLLEKKDHTYGFASEDSWVAFFKRNFEKTRKKDDITAYEFLMKYGFDKNYWNEYIFQAYYNYQNEMIYLTGFPDIPLSMPHSKESQDLLGI